jgi:hypothetical protein
MEWKLDVLLKIWDLAKDNLTTEEIVFKLSLAADTQVRNALHWAALWANVDILQ